MNPAELRGRSVRLMFQDEARFGRMARPRRCWAPAPWQPVMLNGYARQFVYVYGAVSPLQGDLDWMLCTEMNTVRMGEFLSQVSRAHPEEFMVMILDGASSHKATLAVMAENGRIVGRACPFQDCRRDDDRALRLANVRPGAGPAPPIARPDHQINDGMTG